MTRKEAIEKLKYDKSKNQVKGQMDEYWQAFDMAIEELEKKEKYKWHDLRKNPEDLPPMGSLVLIKRDTTKTNWKYPTIVAKRDKHIHVERRWDWIDSYSYVIQEDIIEWCEIEEDNE